MVLAFFTGVLSFARPGSDTSRYMAAFMWVNGIARLLAPMAGAVMLAYISRRSVLICGGVGVIIASALFFRSDKIYGGVPLERKQTA